jgi:hypothetical protein
LILRPRSPAFAGGEARIALDALAADRRLFGVIVLAARDGILFQQAWEMADVAKGTRTGSTPGSTWPRTAR